MLACCKGVPTNEPGWENGVGFVRLALGHDQDVARAPTPVARQKSCRRSQRRTLGEPLHVSLSSHDHRRAECLFGRWIRGEAGLTRGRDSRRRDRDATVIVEGTQADASSMTSLVLAAAQRCRRTSRCGGEVKYRKLQKFGGGTLVRWVAAPFQRFCFRLCKVARNFQKR